MHNTFLLRLSCEPPQAYRYLRVTADQTLYQLHEAISQLYQRNDKDAFVFIIDTHVVSSKHAKALTRIRDYMNTHSDIRYQSGSESNHFTLHIEHVPDQDSQTLFFPAYEAKDSLSSVLTTTKKQPLKRSRISPAVLCEEVRAILMNTTVITPYLILVHMKRNIYPVYLDALDNGLELMFFANLDAYERSVMYSSHEDPDLLFTDACVIDFLYEDLQESELPLYDRHNLCFQIQPGKLPCPFEADKQRHVIDLLNVLLDFLRKETKLPSLRHKECLQIIEDHAEISDYPMHESISLPADAQVAGSLIPYPHTNEQIHLILQVKANENTLLSHSYEIVLYAFNEQFYQEYRLCADTLEQDICESLLTMCRQRGLMEQLHLYSYNLYRTILPLCKELQIGCFLHIEESEKACFLQKSIAEMSDFSQNDVYRPTDRLCEHKKLWSS